jgi:alpha-aminoadipate/glutamate carrier protein LysW
VSIALLKCRECDAEIKIPMDSIEGGILTCLDCGTSYELVRDGDNTTIKPAQIVGEDWGE